MRTNSHFLFFHMWWWEPHDHCLTTCESVLFQFLWIPQNLHIVCTIISLSNTFSSISENVPHGDLFHKTSIKLLWHKRVMSMLDQANLFTYCISHQNFLHTNIHYKSSKVYIAYIISQNYFSHEAILQIYLNKSEHTLWNSNLMYSYHIFLNQWVS